MIRVATLNVRNTADGWRRRRALLVDQLVDLDPHVIALQELRRVPDQSRSIAHRAGRQGRIDYRRLRTGKTGVAGLWEGIGVLSRLPVVERGRLDLGAQHRVALRVTVRLPGGAPLEIYDTHLAAVDEATRTAQARRVLAWMATRPSPHQILLGDLNSRPGSPTVDLISAVMRSAHLAVHGAEPARTAPTPLRRPYTGAGATLDYIFVSDGIEVHDARVVFDRVGPDDHLTASDHYGLTAALSLGRTQQGGD